MQTNFSQRIKNFFSTSYYLYRIVVVENPFRFHSEIQLITYVKKYGLPLGMLQKGNTAIPYQYIGGSMRSCGQCTGLIKGTADIRALNQIANESNIVFFVRGNYKVSYPSYVIPPWAMSINNCGRPYLNQTCGRQMQK